jgi:hypothetical protein
MIDLLAKGSAYIKEHCASLRAESSAARQLPGNSPATLWQLPEALHLQTCVLTI